MADTAIVIKILFSMFSPLFLYVCINRTFKRQNTSCLEARKNIPNICFLLKRWWAEYRISRKTEEAKNCKSNDLENSKIKDKDSANSVLFYGADQKGNSLFVKFSQKALKVAEVSVQLETSNGQLYVLPAYPDTTLTSGLNQEWTAAGLKIEFLQYQQRWRIVYNGLLRNLKKGSECSDENVEHIRMNFIFIENSEALRWPENWSTKLHSEALACEPWRCPQWMNKIKSLEYYGFDQWGSMVGQITYGDGSVSTLFLRGLHQHRWGKHESHEFHESVTLLGVISFGDMFYLNMSSTKHSFPQMQSGQFRDSSETVVEIDQVGLKLCDFQNEKFDTNVEYKTWFNAENKMHAITVKPKNSITLYYGQPWNWMNKIITVEVEMDGRSGFGLLQLCSPYKGPCSAKPQMRLQFLKPVSTSVQRKDYVVHFNDGKCQNENIVGGKGFSLGMLTSLKDAAFIVPKGFCVTVFALELQLHAHKELQKMINDIEHVSVGKKEGDLQKCCYEAVKMIESTSLVDEVKTAILRAVETLESEDGDGKPFQYAVRSSAVGEDSEETSVAGQNSTYLGVRGAENIIQSVAKCWASLFSYQSVQYRKQHGMFIKASMGVCVQKMVNADAAGVMFTRHPTTGDPSDIIITANYGLGESVVSATVEPDTITVHKSWNNELTIKSTVLGNKSHKILSKDNGVVEIELNEEENKKVCLSEQIALRLAAIGVDLETLFGSARDIEWAVVNDTIYLLQARPITTIYTWTDFELTHELDSGVPSDIDILTFANIAEVLPNPVSALTVSVMMKVVNKSTANVYRTVNLNFFSIIGMKCCINYYNMFIREPTKEITLLNKVVDIAVCGSVIITPEMHQIACERNGVTGPKRRIRTLCRMLKEAFFNEKLTNVAKEIRQNLSIKEEDFHTAYSLYHYINQKLENYAKASECHMQASRVSICYQILVMALLTKGYPDIVSEHFSDIALLLGSGSDVISAEAVKKLKRAMVYIKKNEKEEEFKKIDPKKAVDWLKVNCPSAAAEVDDLLKNHGYRCIQEVDFISEPWCLRPESLMSTLQTMMGAPESNNASKLLSPAEAVNRLKTPKSAAVRWILKKLVQPCRNAVISREMTKSIFVSVVHTFRMAYRRLGKLMVLEGYLPSEDLIFYLTVEEIGDILNQHNAVLVQKALRRKRIFPGLRKLEYPEVIIGMPIPITAESEVIVNEKSAKILGTPVSGGSVVNRACVITDLADAHQIKQGDILITHSTDIAWSPYFPLLSGIVTELGGLISHGAVVAREYGLPCIVGAKKATLVFKTGDTVLLAADSGVLQLVEKSG